MIGNDVVFLSGVRTAIGGFGGSLKNISPSSLATEVSKAAIEKSGAASSDFEHSVFGNVIPTDGADTYLARVTAINSGLPETTPALTLNRLCGSGLQAIVTAAQQIQLGHAQLALAGGAESMSRAPYQLPTSRFGQKMGDGVMVDTLLTTLNCPFNLYHMGVTAENVASKYDISREKQDKLALLSHQNAQAATESGKFKEQIIPIDIGKRGKVKLFEQDEHVRFDSALEDLEKLRPAFQKEGTVTAGNASGINDAAAATVIASADYAKENGLDVLARLVDYTVSGVDPKVMGIGPVPAISTLLERNKLTANDIDVYEINEAFAAQAMAVVETLGLPAEKVNPNGSGISLGHPVGATGTICMVKALHELRRIEGRYAMVSLCIGGGQGIAALIERNSQ